MTEQNKTLPSYYGPTGKRLHERGVVIPKMQREVLLTLAADSELIDFALQHGRSASDIYLLVGNAGRTILEQTGDPHQGLLDEYQCDFIAAAAAAAGSERTINLLSDLIPSWQNEPDDITVWGKPKDIIKKLVESDLPLHSVHLSATGPDIYSRSEQVTRILFDPNTTDLAALYQALGPDHGMANGVLETE